MAILCLLKQDFVLNLVVEQRTLLHRLIPILDHLTLFRSFSTALIRMLRLHQYAPLIVLNIVSIIVFITVYSSVLS
jgi:hypothetical protein